MVTMAGALLLLLGTGTVEGRDGDARLRAEERLHELGYFTGSVDGVWDRASRGALRAFQQVERRALTESLTASELEALEEASPPQPIDPAGPHVEIDLERQVLFLVSAGGRVSHAVPVSTGNGRWFRAPGYTARAVTPVGRLAAFKKLHGWHESPFGKMYSPIFIVGGVAIHGHASVPARPASHGCIRVPLYAMDALWSAIAIDTPVLVHSGGSFDNDELLARLEAQRGR